MPGQCTCELQRTSGTGAGLSEYLALHLSITTVRTFVCHMHDTGLDSDGDAQHNEAYNDDESSKYLPNVGGYEPIYTAAHPSIS
jgi:hypothetical protein